MSLLPVECLYSPATWHSITPALVSFGLLTRLRCRHSQRIPSSPLSTRAFSLAALPLTPHDSLQTSGRSRRPRTPTSPALAIPSHQPLPRHRLDRPASCTALTHFAQTLSSSRLSPPLSHHPQRARALNQRGVNSIRKPFCTSSTTTPSDNSHPRRRAVPSPLFASATMSTLSHPQTPALLDSPLREHRLRPVERLTESLETPSLDDRSYRVVKLPNQLEVLLVHDAETDKASAAMDVNVGNFCDPIDLQGLAHCLEHLLFMGTKKVYSMRFLLCEDIP